MSAYTHIKNAWKKPKETLAEAYRQYLIQWRKEPVTVRLEHPTRLDRARALGFKAKQGFLVVRQRVTRGGKMRPKPQGGRSPKKYTRQKVVHTSYQTIAEQRANKQYPNCEVLNSYWVGKDGDNFWYEVILVDVSHPVIQADSRINWICSQRGRVLRGLTSSARKSRGMRHKGTGTEKVRPSLRANKGLLH
ncbi:MAG TPA: 50S ribosomal protein L15e [Acidobacteriota bacterium]|nr:50S ribosomal protein L15e [Acidobacteriota bacterium]